jgi:two-component system, LytTR family, sensor kinase
MERFWKYKVDHAIFWVATIFFHMFTRIQLIQKVGFGQYLLEVIVRNGLLAALIYANIFVLIPRFAQRKKWIHYVAFLLVGFLAYVLLKNAHDVYLYGYVVGDPERRHFFYNTLYNLSIAFFYVTFSIALQLSREWYEQRELIRRIEIEKLNTELEYLKSQINPHFLFNSINTIYFQIDKSNTAARETLSAFSEMLRYQLYECNGKEIQVEKEVAYLRNYVELQKVRKDENYKITFNDYNMHGFCIAPLLLIPFVENAFKYVSHFPNGNEIKIELKKTDNLFCMNVFNTKDTFTKPAGDDHGIGLKNVQRRLQLLYNGKHRISINDQPNSFEVNLEISIA